MKRLVCEMCGGSDLLKQDGVFVCQSCGCKYTLEEARKMMTDGVVEIQGTVRVDSSEELRNLYMAARNARQISDDATALRHYENISAKDPNSWEALFYLVVLKTNSIKNGEIGSAAQSVANSLDRVFQLVKETVPDPNMRKGCVKEIVDQCVTTVAWLSSASESFYDSVTSSNGLMALTGVTGLLISASSTTDAINESQLRQYHIANIMAAVGDCVEAYFGLADEFYRSVAVFAWQNVLTLDETHKSNHRVHLFNDETLNKYKAKSQMRKAAADNLPPQKKSSYEQSLEKWLEYHASGRRKRIFGMIFTIVGFCLFFIVLALLINNYDYPILIIFPLAMLGVGIPFFISGIITCSKANGKISALRKRLGKE